MKIRDIIQIIDSSYEIFEEAPPSISADKSGFNIPAYHGTTASFDAFDPRKTGDIGMHFGTLDQAQNVIRPVFGSEPWRAGGNIIPVLLKLHNPLRVKDMFSTLKTTFINRAKQWCLLTPGFHPSEEERANIFATAKAADLARRRGGNEWKMNLIKSHAAKRLDFEEASRAFWKAIEESVIRQGYDGLVYNNKVEGKGDSYVVFNPNQVRARHANFDPAKADSTNLLDSKQFPLA